MCVSSGLLPVDLNFTNIRSCESLFSGQVSHKGRHHTKITWKQMSGRRRLRKHSEFQALTPNMVNRGTRLTRYGLARNEGHTQYIKLVTDHGKTDALQ